MIKCTLNNDTISRIKALNTLAAKLEKLSDQTLVSFDSDKMHVHITGNKSIVEYTVDTENMQVSGVDYTAVEMSKLLVALQKCNTESQGVNLIIDVDKSKVTVNSVLGKTRITLACYDTVDPNEAKIIMNDWEMRQESDHFNHGTADISISKELLAFADVAVKCMNITGDSNSIGITGSKVSYLDRLCGLEKTLPVPASIDSETFYLQNNLIEFIKPIVKELNGESIPITMSSQRNFARIDVPQIGIRAVLALEETQFPTLGDEEYALVVPTDDNCIESRIVKTDMEAALAKFDGIFNPADYKWKQVNFGTFEDSDDPSKISNKLKLAYDDYNAEVDTDVDITIEKCTSSEKNFSFQIPSLIFSGLLSVLDETDFLLRYSAAPASKDHGRGIEVITPTFKGLCTKLSTV